MAKNSACIVEVTANDAEMEYGPKLMGGFIETGQPMPAEAEGAAKATQYCMCVCCGPICLPLSIVYTTLGWLCFPIGYMVNDEEDPTSWRTCCANYVLCYANRWSFCANLYVFCPCFNITAADFVLKFGNAMQIGMPQQM
eukprot:CAMPEP_0185252756 /NCGR_PEP_ID=MMETSP1359-20130426/1752_1 /TAXON_ID=552665 /ORGANISM="Bigelowiella longifila, Strain CCMP242" /LENGTH=139 /DNA_ID=CAMNT_0027834999 /DNA_START=40 /DNA_END=459 /DNA_ORIENTATION=+